MKCELLAPAKDVEHGKLAVNCGADAVYMGAAKFSARKNASNSTAQMAAMVEYAHRYSVKVYAALNTVLTDAEVEEAGTLLDGLYQAGVDAVIVQDMGLLQAGMPKMPVIASTQVHNHDVEGVRFLEQIGVQRAILARELRPSQIAEIHQAASRIELECFVHGSLCVSYSGRCYLSAASGGRSANRGECAQPCRKRYSLLDRRQQVLKSGHLLSLRDMNRLHELDALLRAGVTSFKIEGRLKNAAYLAATVTAYRHALDGLLASSSTAARDQIENAPTSDVHKVFHRGFVTHFALGNEKMASFHSPKMMGERIGVAAEVNQTRVRIPGATLHAGDGICFFAGGVLRGTRVQRIDGAWTVMQNTESLQVGSELFRNHDHLYVTALEKAAPRRKVPVWMRCEVKDQQLVVSVRDGANNSVSLTTNRFVEPAQDEKKMRATICMQLTKTGETPFEVKELTLLEAAFPFVPISVINDLRRRIFMELLALRDAAMRSERNERGFCLHYAPYPKPVDRYHNVTNHHAEQFYRRCGATTVARGVEEAADFGGVRVMVSKFCLRRELDACLKTVPGAAKSEPWTLRDADRPHTALRLHFYCVRCEMHVLFESEKSTTEGNDA